MVLETDLVSEFFPELKSFAPCWLPLRGSAVIWETHYLEGWVWSFWGQGFSF